MREIVPGILTWQWFSEKHGYDFNGYLVRGPTENLCVDPVEPNDDDLDAIVQEGVARIVLTNRNHFRAAAKVKERTGAAIHVHPADAEFVRAKGTPVDAAIEAGQRIGPFVAIDARGKSPGEIALHWPERRLLLVGDACVGKPPGALALLPAQVIDDLPQLQRSLRRIAETVDFETLLVGDGAPVLSGGCDALRRLVMSFT
jgi:glyoxylase-like metal-dependent hydrolase (beta-lactamase superfamily II)